MAEGPAAETRRGSGVADDDPDTLGAGAPEAAEQRIAAAVAAGGTVDDSDSPSLTVITDQDGNKGIVCVAQPAAQQD